MSFSKANTEKVLDDLLLKMAETATATALRNLTCAAGRVSRAKSRVCTRASRSPTRKPPNLAM